MVQIEVSNEQDQVEISETLVEWLEKASEVAVRFGGGNEGAEATIILVDDEYIRELNQTYRNIDSPTDVLSFAMQESVEGEPEILGLDEDLNLGDVYISLQTAERQAAEYGHSLTREIVYLAVHGMLHLLGFDHLDEEEKKVMRQKEDAVMESLNLGRDVL